MGNDEINIRHILFVVITDNGYWDHHLYLIWWCRDRYRCLLYYSLLRSCDVHPVWSGVCGHHRFRDNTRAMNEHQMATT